MRRVRPQAGPGASSAETPATPTPARPAVSARSGKRGWGAAQVTEAGSVRCQQTGPRSSTYSGCFCGDSSLPLPARLTFLTGAPGPRGRVTRLGARRARGRRRNPGNPETARTRAPRALDGARAAVEGSTSLRTSTICCQAKTGRSAGTKAAGTGCTRAHALAPAPSCTARRGIVCTNGTTTVAASSNRRAKPAQR